MILCAILLEDFYVKWISFIAMSLQDADEILVEV